MNNTIESSWAKFEQISHTYDELPKIESIKSKVEIEKQIELLQKVIITLSNLNGQIEVIIFNNKLNNTDKKNANNLHKSISIYNENASNKLRLYELELSKHFAESGIKRDYSLFKASIFAGLISGVICSLIASLVFYNLFQEESSIQMRKDITDIQKNVNKLDTLIDRKIFPLQQDMNCLMEISNRVDSIVTTNTSQ